jgi:hypothetical protein
MNREMLQIKKHFVAYRADHLSHPRTTINAEQSSHAHESIKLLVVVSRFSIEL